MKQDRQGKRTLIWPFLKISSSSLVCFCLSDWSHGSSFVSALFQLCEQFNYAALAGFFCRRYTTSRNSVQDPLRDPTPHDAIMIVLLFIVVWTRVENWKSCCKKFPDTKTYEPSLKIGRVCLKILYPGSPKNFPLFIFWIYLRKTNRS